MLPSQPTRWLHRLSTFRRLPPDDRGGLLLAWVLLLCLRLLCRLIGVRASLGCLRWLTLGAAPSPPPTDWICRQVELVHCAARYCPVPATCLVRAMTLWFLLARRGVVGDIILGVAKTPASLEAHAWVEWQGAPLMEAPDVRQRYAVFDTPLSAA
ncbi:MAG: lasso peptide biosynthesis B2 protein [Chloracidobacterium sp.]